MNDKILLRFLNAGLINVGGDDTKLAKLDEAVADLAEALKDVPDKAVPFALVAFDPEASTESPVIREVADAVQARWTTYINTFAKTPVAVFRGMLLAALVRATADEERIGVAFVALARNVLPFSEVGAEGSIWADAVRDIERQIDKRAEAEWATPETIQAPPVAYEPPAAIEVVATRGDIDEADLVKRIIAACGPSNGAGHPTGGNPYWPNSTQSWAQEFATRFAAVIVSAVEAGEGAGLDPIDLSRPLQGLVRAVKAHAEGTLKAVSEATAGLQRRTNLIWWKEALFSPSARVCYRGLPPSCAAALMAYDLHCQVPTFSPTSVSAFLHESVLGLPSVDETESFPIAQLLREARDADDLAPLRDAARDLAPITLDRDSVLALLGEPSDRAALDDPEFRARVGVPATTELTIPKWATWLFCEMQAIRASREAADAKRRECKAK